MWQYFYGSLILFMVVFGAHPCWAQDVDRRWTISGRVLDDAGRPVPRAQIGLTDSESMVMRPWPAFDPFNEIHGETLTADDGSFSLGVSHPYAIPVCYKRGYVHKSSDETNGPGSRIFECRLLRTGIGTLILEPINPTSVAAREFEVEAKAPWRAPNRARGSTRLPREVPWTVSVTAGSYDLALFSIDGELCGGYASVIVMPDATTTVAVELLPTVAVILTVRDSATGAPATGVEVAIDGMHVLEQASAPAIVSQSGQVLLRFARQKSQVANLYFWQQGYAAIESCSWPVNARYQILLSQEQLAQHLDSQPIEIDARLVRGVSVRCKVAFKRSDGSVSAAGPRSVYLAGREIDVDSSGEVLFECIRPGQYTLILRTKNLNVLDVPITISPSPPIQDVQVSWP